MGDDSLKSLSRRERQIMDIILQMGQATAAEIQLKLPDTPSYSTVRALLRILEQKGHLKHKNKGVKYLYYPVITKKKAQKNAIGNLLKTFFNNSTEEAVAALISYDKKKLTEDDLARIEEIIKKARKEDEE